MFFLTLAWPFGSIEGNSSHGNSCRGTGMHAAAFAAVLNVKHALTAPLPNTFMQKRWLEGIGRWSGRGFGYALGCHSAGVQNMDACLDCGFYNL